MATNLNPIAGLPAWGVTGAIVIVIAVWIVSSGQWQPLFNFATQKAVP